MADVDAEPVPAAGEAEVAAEVEAVMPLDEDVDVEDNSELEVFSSDEEANRLIASAEPMEMEEAEDEADEAAVAAMTDAGEEEVKKEADQAAVGPGGSEAEAAGSKEATEGAEAASSVFDDVSKVRHSNARGVVLAAASAVPDEAKQRLAALEDASSWVDCSKEQASVMAWSGKRDVFFKLADTIAEVRDDDERGLRVDKNHIITMDAHKHRVVCSIFIGEASEQGQRELQELLGIEQLPKCEWLIIHSAPSEADALGLGMCKASQVESVRPAETQDYATLRTQHSATVARFVQSIVGVSAAMPLAVVAV